MQKKLTFPPQDGNEQEVILRFTQVSDYFLGAAHRADHPPPYIFEETETEKTLVLSGNFP